MVQFFIFKNNAAVQVNRHRKMIISQIEDFLNSGKSIEDVQVVRKLTSITLQIDEQSVGNVTPITESFIPALEQEEDFVCGYDYEEAISEPEPEDEDTEIIIQNEEAETVVIVSDYLPCSKCGEVLTCKKTLEIHEFFKHSLFGVHIENEVEQSQEVVVGDDGEPNFIKKCANCATDFYDSHSLKHHLLASHSSEIQQNVNELLAVDTTAMDQEVVSKYVEHIRELLQLQVDCVELQIDENIKKHFYQFYCGEAFKTAEAEPVASNSEKDDNDLENEEVQVKKKVEKNATNLTVESRTWLKREINMRRQSIQTESGARVIYRCVYCNIYSSNSAPGFRYHLISKHLKHNNLQNLQVIGSDFEPPPLKTTVSLRNICTDCNLKFKDWKIFEGHQNSHKLFAVISEYYYFPTCNTCNKLFIDDSSLKLHLAKHDANENIEEPIPVPLGAIVMQGRQLEDLTITQPYDIKGDGSVFWWSCGHCSKKFPDEFLCRNHLLMLHASTFTCPIDKLEFSEHKAVSLFSHHIKNKHQELFPDISFSCTFCKMNFPTVYDKLSHMKSCSLRKFSCDHCGKRFFRKGDLFAHLRFISGELFFACKICHKKCETMSDLKIHLRSHTKEVSIKIAMPKVRIMNQ